MRNRPDLGRARPRAGLAALGAAAIVLLGACGSPGPGDASPPTSTTSKAVAKATTTTTAKATTATTEVDDTPSVVDVWNVDAQQWRGRNGASFTVDCPPKGTPHTIWGVEAYTDDSSICTAGVHLGLITLAAGGKVTIKIAPGQDAYDAGIAHGVTSTEYRAWDGSFTFPAAPPGSGQFVPTQAAWSDSVQSLNLKLGVTKTIACTGGGRVGSVWGTGTYTADSYICTAAVHDGLITQVEGGSVNVEVTGGRTFYKGSTAHGITSSSYGAFPLSFSFPDDQPKR